MGHGDLSSLLRDNNNQRICLHIERAVILGDGSLLKPENFLFHSSVRQKKEEEVLNLELLERQAVEKAMRLSEGNITRAAEYLGITRFALYRKLEKLGL